MRNKVKGIDLYSYQVEKEIEIREHTRHCQQKMKTILNIRLKNVTRADKDIYYRK